MWECLQDATHEPLRPDIIIDDAHGNVPLAWYAVGSRAATYHHTMSHKAASILMPDAKLMHLYKAQRDDNNSEQYNATREITPSGNIYNFTYTMHNFHMNDKVPSDTIVFGMKYSDQHGELIAIFDVALLGGKDMRKIAPIQRAAALHAILPMHSDVSPTVRIHFHHVGFLYSIMEYFSRSDNMHQARVVVLPDELHDGDNFLTCIDNPETQPHASDKQGVTHLRLPDGLKHKRPAAPNPPT